MGIFFEGFDLHISAKFHRESIFIDDMFYSDFKLFIGFAIAAFAD